MTAEIIQFTKGALPIARHAALLPSAGVAELFGRYAWNNGGQWHILIWPGEENTWVRDGYTIIAI